MYHKAITSDLRGSGEAIIFKDGKEVGSWKYGPDKVIKGIDEARALADAQISLYQSADEEQALKAKQSEVAKEIAK